MISNFVEVTGSIWRNFEPQPVAISSIAETVREIVIRRLRGEGYIEKVNRGLFQKRLHRAVLLDIAVQPMLPREGVEFALGQSTS